MVWIIPFRKYSLDVTQSVVKFKEIETKRRIYIYVAKLMWRPKYQLHIYFVFILY